MATLPQRGLSMNVGQLVGSREPWRCQVYRDIDSLNHRSYGPIRVFLASVSWWSEALFDLSFSVIPPIQALKGLPWLGFFSVVWHIRYFKGPASIVQLPVLTVWGERLQWWLHPYIWLFSIALPPWLPVFPPWAFPTTVFSLRPPWAMSP